MKKASGTVREALRYYFVPTRAQLARIILVGVIAFAIIVGLLATRADILGRFYQLVAGIPVTATFSAREIVPCPTPGDQDRVCPKYTQKTQPIFP
jgi:hypothetical protein